MTLRLVRVVYGDLVNTKQKEKEVREIIMVDKDCSEKGDCNINARETNKVTKQK